MPRGLPVLIVSALLLIGAAIEVFAGSDRAQRDELASMLAAAGFITLGVGLAQIARGYRGERDERDSSGDDRPS